MATGLNPRRIHEALCPNHLAKAAHQWPVDGDLKLLFDQCVDCEDVLRNLFAGEDSWWLRLFAGFPVALVEHQAATHEAAHAVVGVVTGHPLERVWIAENGGGEGATEPGGAVDYGPWAMPLEDHLAAVWAGLEGSLRWLLDHELDMPENRIDVVYGSWNDAVQAHAMTDEDQVPRYFGRAKAATLVDLHWRQIQRLANALLEHRDISGDEVRAMLYESPIPATRLT